MERLLSRLELSLWSARVATFILIAVTVLAPLPFGSASPTAMAFLVLWLGLGLVFASATIKERRQKVLLSLVGIVAAAYAVILHEQLAAHPWFASVNPLWKEVADAL